MFGHFRFQQESDSCSMRRQMHHARFGGHRERFERGFGGGRERMFEGGELKLVILHLLSEQPSYGYQLIKTMEDKLSGGYAPSPGVVYPTLTLLEEEGFTTAAVNEAGKKVYTVSTEGKEHLTANKRHLDEVLARLQQAGEEFQRGRTPQVMQAFLNLRGAVKARVSRESLTKEQLARITDAINAAAKAIDEL